MRHPRPRTLTALAVATATVLAVPAAADAAFTATKVGPTITFTGDAANDNLVISDSGGLLVHNQTGGGFNSPLDFDTTVAGDQSQLANGTGAFLVDLGDGDDTAAITGNTTGSVLTGGGGDDIIGGSAAPDTLNGGIGDDRLTGARGADEIHGDAGNDVMIWNNGDGSDINDGGAGADETEVNGAPTAADQFRVQPGAVAGHVRFDRINLGLFNLDLSATERITMNGLGGDDDIQATGDLAPLILVTANGGTGNDTLVGASGADLLNGGDDNDTLTGGGGDDRLVGDRGADTMNGSDGADTLVWNNGDGSDVINGEGGLDRTEVNGAPGAGDVFTVAPNGARVKFDRTNLGLFSLDIGTSEALQLNPLGGNDTVTAAPGVGSLIALTVDGGSGNDAITGAEGDDTLTGGADNDTITGGLGRDLLDGLDGDDVFAAREGIEDLVRCGVGADSVVADALGVDALSDCETVDRTAATPGAGGAPGPGVPAVPTPGAGGAPGPGVGDTQGTAVQLTGKAKLVKQYGRQVLKLAVTCPAGEAGGCVGTLRVSTASPVTIGGVKVTALLGTATFKVAAGKQQALSVKLPAGVQRLAKSGSLKLGVSTLSRDAAGNVGEGSASLRVKLAR